MNTQKSVFNRLFSEPKKTELETHKVELGLIDDLKSDYNKVLKEYSKVKKQVKTALTDLKKQKDIIQKLDLDFMDWLGAFNDAEKTAKDLGIELPSEMTKLESKVVKEWNESKTLGSQIKKINI